MVATSLYETLLEATPVTYFPPQGKESGISIVLEGCFGSNFGATSVFYFTMKLTLPSTSGAPFVQKKTLRALPAHRSFLDEEFPLLMEDLMEYYGALDALCKAQGWASGIWLEEAPLPSSSHSPDLVDFLYRLPSRSARSSFLLTCRPRGPWKRGEKVLEPLQLSYLESYPVEEISDEFSSVSAWAPWVNLLGPEAAPLVFLVQRESAPATYLKRTLLPLASTLAQGRLLQELAWNVPSTPEAEAQQEELVKLLEVWRKIPAGEGTPFRELPPESFRRLLGTPPRFLRKWKLELPLRLKEYRSWVASLPLGETLFLKRATPAAGGALAASEARGNLLGLSDLTDAEHIVLISNLWKLLDPECGYFSPQRMVLESLSRRAASNRILGRVTQAYLQAAEEKGTSRETQVEVLLVLNDFGMEGTHHRGSLAGPPQAKARMGILAALAGVMPLEEIPPLLAAVEKAATEMVTLKEWSTYFKDREQYKTMPPAWWLSMVKA